ncbi:hypothetical protein M3Y97_00196300 [Aphelenchoides bicaudatus]|nr:hypothetical protein M3Y97_00196300 [Aphelenchoides bicaudatus]
MAIPTAYRNFEARLIFLTITFYGLGVFVSIYNGIKTTIFNPVEQWYSYVIVSDSVALLPSVFFLVASSGLREAVFPDEFRVWLWRLYMQTMCQNVSFTSYTTPTSIQLTNSRNNPNGAVSMIPRPVVSMSSMPSQKLILTARDTQSSHPALIII